MYCQDPFYTCIVVYVRMLFKYIPFLFFVTLRDFSLAHALHRVFGLSMNCVSTYSYIKFFAWFNINFGNHHFVRTLNISKIVGKNHLIFYVIQTKKRTKVQETRGPKTDFSRRKKEEENSHLYMSMKYCCILP